MSGRFLLDTNIIIGLLKREASILAAIADASELFVPVIALGESYFGAARSSRPQENQAVIDQFLDGRAVLFCDLAVAREYGRLKSQLTARGTPLPENDMWIAATALRHGLTVASRDRHFREIEGLDVVGWHE